MYLNLISFTNTNLINNIEELRRLKLNDKSGRFAVHETVTFQYNQYTGHRNQ